MGRRRNEEHEIVLARMQAVIGNITDRRDLRKVKTWDDLWEVAHRWCMKDYRHCEETAAEWGVEPVYLLLTALVYVEHPLLFDGGRLKYDFPRCLAEIVSVELRGVPQPVPIKSTNSIHRGVEEKAEVVERMG